MWAVCETTLAGFHCNSVNVVPKKGTDKFRLVHNSFHPFGDDSVNSPEEASVSYQKFNQFTNRVRRAGYGAQLGKFDLTGANKSVLVHPSFWHPLGLCLDSRA